MEGAKHVQIELGNGCWIRVQIIAPGTFWFRMNDTGHFQDSPLLRYRILNVPFHPVHVHSAPRGEPISLHAGQTMLHIDTKDGQFQMLDRAGRVRLQTSHQPWSASDTGFGAHFLLHRDEALYGLGNVAPEQIQRRGVKVTMRVEGNNWASAPIPYLMSTGGWALMMNTIRPHAFDIGSEADDRLSIEGQTGELDLFLFAGESLAELLHAYTDVAGKPQLMPIWMYGLNFCSRTHSDARTVLDDAIKFRKSEMPCDLIGVSSDWMGTANDYSTSKTWHPERFPISTNDLLRKVSFIGILQKHGFKFSLTLGCDYDLTVYEEQLADGGKTNGRAGQQEIWYDHLRKFVNDGVSAFVLVVPSLAFWNPERIWGNGMTSAELHNLYAVLLAKQMHAGFREQTDTRPVIHLEKGYLGIQQFAVSTAGTFYNGSLAITAILNYGLSGHANATTNMHLVAREGIHADFLLSWTRINSLDHFHHPDFLEPSLQELFRRYARLRYSLIPYLYSAAHIAAVTGMPITRAMPLMYPDDRHCRDLCQQFMLGDFLLVAVYTDQVYLPEGDWFDYWTGERYSGARSLDYHLPPQAGGPLFVRAGAILPLWPPMDFIGQVQPSTLTLHIYPGADGAFDLYEDDGTSFDYLNGRLARTRITVEESPDLMSVRISRREGEYMGMPQKRSYEMIIHAESKPTAVKVNGQRRKDQTKRVKADPIRSYRYDRPSATVRLYVEEAEGEERETCIEVIRIPMNKPAAKVAAEAIASDEQGATDSADRTFIAALTTGDPDAEAAITTWWNTKMKHGQSDSVWPLLVMDGYRMLVQHAAENGWTAEELYSEGADLSIALTQLQSSAQGYELLRKLATHLARYTEAQRPTTKHAIINEVLAYVKRELDRDLSLNAMAERFSVHPFHLSRLFKKETGRTYSDYIMSIRMQRAKTMLEAGYKVYEAAEQNGYKDSGTFSKAFSKYWGYPPANVKSRMRERLPPME